jgi:hypothetical protein
MNGLQGQVAFDIVPTLPSLPPAALPIQLLAISC